MYPETRDQGRGWWDDIQKVQGGMRARYVISYRLEVNHIYLFNEGINETIVDK